jgi:predicted metal-binding membrane protein
VTADASAIRAALPKREKLFVLAGLIGLAALAWLYLLLVAADTDHTGDHAAMPFTARPWTATDAALTFLMWAAMMIGMMAPSAAPMVLLHAAFWRKQIGRPGLAAPTAAFVAGYVAAWTVFSLAATALQWGLDQAALLTPGTAAASPMLGALLLFAAGAYQLTPLKHACLKGCRSPLQFLMAHWRPGVGGALSMGIRHGALCLGCCWVLMGLLFVGGVMNPMWVAAIAALVMVEKLTPRGDALGRIGGAGLIVAGGWLLAAGP